ncbi:hypothetical protein [Geomicrobium sp. JCM 19055]|nr:hypothetical protein [Geomicrobium sp. JCM 19055]
MTDGRANDALYIVIVKQKEAVLLYKMIQKPTLHLVNLTNDESLDERYDG